MAQLSGNALGDMAQRVKAVATESDNPESDPWKPHGGR